jgi:hypothetical protein
MKTPAPLVALPPPFELRTDASRLGTSAGGLLPRTGIVGNELRVEWKGRMDTLRFEMSLDGRTRIKTI